MAELEQKQGFLGNLDEKTKSELQELLTRQERLLKNRKFVDGLADKGEKIRSLVSHLRCLIAGRERLDAAADLLEAMTTSDEHMHEPDQLKLDGKDVNVINRISGVDSTKGKKSFHPHKSLRSTLGDLVEDISTDHTNTESAPRDKLPSAIPVRDNKELLDQVRNVIQSADDLSCDALRKYESKCPSLHRQQPQTCRLDPCHNYTVIVFHLLKNRPGENAEICRVLARSIDELFSGYCIPSYISTGITRHYGVKIEYRRGTRILARQGQDTQAEPVQIVLKNFIKFLEKYERVILLSFGESSTLLHNLRSSKLPAPEALYINCPFTLLSSVTNEKILSEQRVVDILSNLVDSRGAELLDPCRIYDLHNAEALHDEMVECSRRLNSMRGKLFDFSIKEKEVVTTSLARTLASVGLSYDDLDKLYRESELCLVAVLTRTADGVRVTRDEEDIAALINYFRMKHKHESHHFDEVLMEGAQAVAQGSKLVPLEESLQLMYDQRRRMERIQIEQAKQKLMKNVDIKMKPFDPEASKTSLKYRERAEESEDEAKDEDDSEGEQDYPE